MNSFLGKKEKNLFFLLMFSYLFQNSIKYYNTEKEIKRNTAILKGLRSLHAHTCINKFNVCMFIYLYTCIEQAPQSFSLYWRMQYEINIVK